MPIGWSDVISGSSSQSSAWVNWNGSYIATASATTTWAVWNQSHCVSDYVVTTGNATWPTLTEQQQEQQETDRLARAERQVRDDEAQKKATALLMAHLDTKQREDFQKSKHFIVHARNGERQYLIEYGKAGNIKLIRDGRPIEKYCIHPDVVCPTEDVMLAQKLLLEADEEHFLKVANKTVLAALVARTSIPTGVFGWGISAGDERERVSALEP